MKKLNICLICIVFYAVTLSTSSVVAKSKKSIQNECVLKIHAAVNKVCLTDNPSNGHIFENCQKIGDEETIKLIQKNVEEKCYSRIKSTWDSIKVKKADVHQKQKELSFDCKEETKRNELFQKCIHYIYQKGLDNFTLTVQNDLNNICGESVGGQNEFVVKLIQAIKGDFVEKVQNKSGAFSLQQQVDNLKKLEQFYLKKQQNSCGKI